MAALDDYGPFDSGVGANRTEDFWRDFFRHLTGSGVIDGVGSEFAVVERGAGANLSVDVGSGECFIRGHWAESTSTKNVAISTGDATDPRIDRVVLRADFTANTVSIEVLEGTPAGSPSAPALTQSSSRWEISLAQISVPALDTSIATAQITDERTVIAWPIAKVNSAPTDGQVLTWDSTNGWQPETVAAALTEIVIPAASFGALAGSPAIGDAGGGAYAAGLRFDSSAAEVATAWSKIPANWAAVHVDLVWTNSGAGSGNARWGYILTTSGDGEDFETGSSTAANIAAPAQSVVKVSTLTSGGGVGVTAGEYVNVYIARVGSDVGDTLGNDAALLAVVLRKAS